MMILMVVVVYYIHSGDSDRDFDDVMVMNINIIVLRYMSRDSNVNFPVNNGIIIYEQKWR